MRTALRTIRYWLPLVVGFACQIASLYVGAIASWLLIVVGFGLLLDGLTAMWAKAGGIGTLATYRR